MNVKFAKIIIKIFIIIFCIVTTCSSILFSLHKNVSILLRKAWFQRDFEFLKIIKKNMEKSEDEAIQK